MDERSKKIFEAAKAGRAQWLKQQETARRLKKLRDEMKKARRDAYIMQLAHSLNEARKADDFNRFTAILDGAKL